MQRAFTETAIALFNSSSTTASSESYENAPKYGVGLTKPAGAQGFYGAASQGVVKYSFEGLGIAIAPVPEPGTVLGVLGAGLLGLGDRCKRSI